ncbi:MAG: GC-type dockerin domain-anchored protein [Phycisphaerales bacterium]
MPKYSTAAAVLAIAGLAMITTKSHSQSTMEWAMPVDGDFGEASNWFPAVVPSVFDTAVFGGVGAYVVRVTGRGDVGSVELTNPQAAVQIENGGRLFVYERTRGPGVFAVSDGVTTDGVAVLYASSGALIDGLVRLDGAADHNAEAQGQGRIVLGSNGVITGQGRIRDDVWAGTVLGSAGQTLDMRNILLWEAILDATDGTFRTDSGTLLRATVIRGTYRIDPGNAMTLREGVTIEDEIIVGDGVMIAGAATLFVRGGVTVDGVIRLNGAAGIQATFRDSTGVAGGDVFLGEDTVVSGQGTIIGDIFSDGLIEARPDGVLYFIGTLTGGELRSNAGSRVVLQQCRLLDGVLIDATAGGRFFTDRDTVVRHSTIRGEMSVLPFYDLTLGPDVAIEGAIVVSDGVTTTNEAGLFVEEGAVLDGLVRLHGAETSDAFVYPDAGTLTLGPSARITGQGRIFGPATIAGTVAPGSDGGAGGIGRMELRGVFDFEQSSRLELDIAGPEPDQHDGLTGPDSITLGGTLAVGYEGGYLPGLADRFQIITGLTVHGRFDAVESADPAGIGPAHLIYGTSIVTLVPCAADRDGDGELTLFDFLAFQNQFDLGDLQADLDGDGVLTIFDLLAFQNRFDAGCG